MCFGKRLQGGLLRDLVRSLCLAELPGGFWGAPVGCTQGPTGAGCPDRVHGSRCVCRQMQAGRRVPAGPGRAEPSQESCVGGSPPQPWGCSALPGGAGGHRPPDGALLPSTGLHGCKEKALPPWPQHHGRAGGTGIPLVIMPGRQKPVNYPIHFPLLCWLVVAD